MIGSVEEDELAADDNPTKAYEVCRLPSASSAHVMSLHFSAVVLQEESRTDSEAEPAGREGDPHHGAIGHHCFQG